MKKLLTFFLLLISLAFFGGVALAQETDEGIAAKYGVTFPISELGDCGSLFECRTFCEDPVNQEICISFAKEKGFYDEEDFEVDDGIIRRAQSVLGCNSISSCLGFCSQEVNFDKCHSFATSNGLVGGYIHDVDSGEFLDKAREVLGCDSYNTCKNFCENPTNRDKCSQFASDSGLNGGYEYRGPGGCTTEETCRNFCSNPGNVEICRSFSEGHGGSFIGSGGCSDEASCRSYCERNPSACGGGENFERDYDPAQMCSRTPSCSWTGTNCECKSGESFQGDPATECSKYGCSWTGSSCSCSSNNADYLDRQKTECSKYPGCSWSGDHCQCSNSNINYSSYSGDPAAECTKYTGCKWESNSCQCDSAPSYNSGGSGTYATPYSQPSYDPATECAKASGCSWNGSSCQCSSSGGSTPSSGTTAQPPSGSTMDPATACAQTSGCSWNGSTCQCAPVQGITTVYINTWWQKLLDLLQ